jgi:hypothetical protein
MTKYLIGETLRVNGRRDGVYRGNGIVEIDSEQIIEPRGEAWYSIKPYLVTLQPQWTVETRDDIYRRENRYAHEAAAVRAMALAQMKELQK